MSKKISYSAYRKYVQCPKMYQYHYEQRLRPTGISSALVFGTAIDAALNALLLGKGDPVGVFQGSFKFEDLKDVTWDYKKDLQLDLFTESQMEGLVGQSDDYKSWASMRIKGRLLIEAYQEYIFPQIIEVHGVQKELNSRPGILDAVLSLSGYGLVLADHKTSGGPYQTDALETDTQLALYAQDQGIDQVAYIVLNKNIKFIKKCTKCGYDGTYTQHKTCPSTAGNDNARCFGLFDRSADKSKIVQLIVGKVKEINKNNIVSSIETVEKCISQKLFPMNVNSCGAMYGKPCPYLNKCWKNDSTSLVEVPEIKEVTEDKGD